MTPMSPAPDFYIDGGEGGEALLAPRACRIVKDITHDKQNNYPDGSILNTHYIFVRIDPPFDKDEVPGNEKNIQLDMLALSERGVGQRIAPLREGQVMPAIIHWAEKLESGEFVPAGAALGGLSGGKPCVK